MAHSDGLIFVKNLKFIMCRWAWINHTLVGSFVQIDPGEGPF